MAYNQPFVDSDILLDMLLKREPFDFYTKILLLENERGRFKLHTSCLIIANIHYILSKKAGVQASKDSIKKLMSSMVTLPFENDVLNAALLGNVTDLEDAIQISIAEKFKCDAILTRNIKDYKKSTIPVLTAGQFLRTL